MRGAEGCEWHTEGAYCGGGDDPGACIWLHAMDLLDLLDLVGCTVPVTSYVVHVRSTGSVPASTCGSPHCTRMHSGRKG